MKRRCHSVIPDVLPQFTERLRRESRKVTGPRQAILQILREYSHPMSSKEIFAGMGKDYCDLATVYRSMHLLQSMGIVKRFEFGDGVARFELLKEGDSGHHHHLVCTCCSGVVEIEECIMEEMEAKLAEQNGYKAVTHKLEFFGICPECQ